MAQGLATPVAFMTNLREFTRWCSEAFGSSVKLPKYAVSTLPPAETNEGGMIYVSDATGGAIPAFSDGISWRRADTRAVVS